ncbi:hypothetical protein [Haladaptatus halobius]|uniref:hypothetical protein n=1 Tax=Haladaptatus halobius TaxID=2884875 RepID=UPI001D09DB84|nr:hypothetical protein [Haladaptatus halobius]
MESENSRNGKSKTEVGCGRNGRTAAAVTAIVRSCLAYGQPRSDRSDRNRRCVDAHDELSPMRRISA